MFSCVILTYLSFFVFKVLVSSVRSTTPEDEICPDLVLYYDDDSPLDTVDSDGRLCCLCNKGQYIYVKNMRVSKIKSSNNI